MCSASHCVLNTIKYILNVFNVLVFLLGLTVFGCSIYALVGGGGFTHLVEKGSAELKTPITLGIMLK